MKQRIETIADLRSDLVLQARIGEDHNHYIPGSSRRYAEKGRRVQCLAVLAAEHSFDESRLLVIGTGCKVLEIVETVEEGMYAIVQVPWGGTYPDTREFDATSVASAVFSQFGGRKDA